MKVSLAVRFAVFITFLLSIFAIVLSLVLFEQFRSASSKIRSASLDTAEYEMLAQVRKEGVALAQTLASSLADHIYFYNWPILKTSLRPR